MAPQQGVKGPVKFFKPGKVVIMLGGKYAGKKAVIVRTHDIATKRKPYGTCLVAGVLKSPLKVTKGMSQAKIARRSGVKPFVKTVNYYHVMPTRYQVELKGLTEHVTETNVKDPSKRVEVKKAVKKEFENKYLAGKNAWFFKRLRF